MAASKRDNNDWVRTLNSLNERRGRFPPDFPGEWKTFEEIFSEMEFGANKLRAILQEGIKENKFEAFEGSRPNVTGKMARAVWYRPIKVLRDSNKVE